MALYSRFKRYTGEYDDAIRLSERSVALNPNSGFANLQLAFHYWYAHDYAAAVTAFDKVLRPNANIYAWVAAAYARLGRTDAAREKLEDFFRQASTMLAAPKRDDGDGWQQYWAMAFPTIDSAARDHFYDGLRKAGLAI